MNNTFRAEIIECSKDLTPRERIIAKDTSNCISLDKATDSEDVHICLDYFVVLSIHNEKSDRGDYENYILVDKSGEKYVTGSPSFWNAFTSIWDEMKDLCADGYDEDINLCVYKLDSKNYKGKKFITCSLE